MYVCMYVYIYIYIYNGHLGFVNYLSPPAPLIDICGFKNLAGGPSSAPHFETSIGGSCKFQPFINLRDSSRSNLTEFFDK